MSEIATIQAGFDVVAGRGFLVEYNAETLQAVFTRIQKIYSTAGTSTCRVWDVVDYSESDKGSHVMTCGTAREAKRMVALR